MKNIYYQYLKSKAAIAKYVCSSAQISTTGFDPTESSSGAIEV